MAKRKTTRKTTTKELEQFIKKQGQHRDDTRKVYTHESGYAPLHVPTGDVNLLTRKGIVRPTRDNPYPEIPKIRNGNYPDSLARGRTPRKYHRIITIVGLLGAIFFLSPNLTGNTIANISQSSSNWLSAILFIVGLAGAFFWVNKE